MSVIPEISSFYRKLGAMSLSRYAAIIMALAAAMVLTRLLEEEAYGAYRKVWLLYGILGPAFVNTLAGTLYFRAKAADRDTAISVNLFLGGAYGLMTAFVAFVFAGFWATQLNVPELSDAFRNFAIYMGLSVFAGIAEPLFVSIRRKKWLMGYSVGYNIIEFFLIVIPFWMGLSIPTVFLIMSAGPALRTLILLFISFYHLEGLPQRSSFSGELRQSLTYGRGLFMLTIVSVAAVQADKWVIGIFFEENALYAIYEIGAKKIPFIAAFCAAVGASFVSEYSARLREGDYTTALNELRRLSSWLSLLLLPALIFFLVFAEEVLFILFGGYADSAPIFRIYLFTIIGQLVFPHSVLLALGRSDVTAGYSAVEFLFNLVLSVLLVIWIGITGPAWATMLAHLLYILLLLRYCSVKYNIRATQMLPGRALLPLAVSLPLLIVLAAGLKYGAGLEWAGFGITALAAGGAGAYHIWNMKKW